MAIVFLEISILLLCVSIFSGLLYFRKLRYPYNTIKILSPFKHGWNNTYYQMKSLLKSHNIKTVIEVGSWLGESTIGIAERIPFYGKVYAVDHWIGSEEHSTDEKLKTLLPVLYQQFLSNVIHKKLAHKIIPVRMTSLEASKALKDVKPDLIYLDAAHDTKSVLEDLNAWYPFIKEKGIICGDDWLWPSVRLGVETFAKENHLEIISEKSFWRLKK